MNEWTHVITFTWQGKSLMSNSSLKAATISRETKNQQITHLSFLSPNGESRETKLGFFHHQLQSARELWKKLLFLTSAVQSFFFFQWDSASFSFYWENSKDGIVSVNSSMFLLQVKVYGGEEVKFLEISFLQLETGELMFNLCIVGGVLKGTFSVLKRK